MTAPSHYGAAPAWDVPPQRFDLNEERAADGHLGGFEAVTDLAACILPLLSSLGWEGDLVHVAESLPHFADTLDLTDLLNIMANLGYASKSLDLSPSRMDPRLMPCLYMAPGELSMVLVRPDEDGKVVAFDAQTRAYVTIDPPDERGRIYRFNQLDEDERSKLEDAPKNFVFAVTGRFRPLFVRMLATSLVSNLLVLVTPLFIMAIYDQFLPTGSIPLLVSLLAGSVIAILGDYAIKGVRSRMIAYLGARMDHLLGLAIFRRLLMLAPPFTEQANSNSQIARLRDFEMVREFFTGPLATTMAEAPFIIVFLIAMAVLGGPLVFVPLGALVLFTLIAMVTRPLVERKVSAATRAASRRQEFLVEALTKPRTIKEAGAAGIWWERFRTLSADAALKNHQSNRANVVVSTASQGLVMLNRHHYPGLGGGTGFGRQHDRWRPDGVDDRGVVGAASAADRLHPCRADRARPGLDQPDQPVDAAEAGTSVGPVHSDPAAIQGQGDADQRFVALCRRRRPGGAGPGLAGRTG